MGADLQDVRVLVTGASSGIGAATARALAAQGARVAVLARRRDKLDDLVAEIAAEGTGSATAYDADVTDAEALGGAVDRVVEDLQGLDALVSCAGYLFNTPALEADLDQWRQMVEVNVVGVLQATRVALPHLVESAAGPRGVADVVTISSIAGRRVPSPQSNVYSATKHAVGAFSEALRQELADRQVRVGVVEPGVVRTEMTTTEQPGAPDARTGRPLEAEDIADAVLYMLTRPPHVAVNEILLRPSEQIT